MRPDLASRLRDIVRQQVRPGAPAPPAPRELTYVAEPDPSSPAEGVAAALGGRTIGDTGACIAIERVYDGTMSHGRRRIESCVPTPAWPVELLDTRLAAAGGEWWRHVVFFDIETTGLSGGAGTIAFLIGCGWFEAESFRVRQFLLAAPSGEHVMLQALGEIVREASLLVTYNGRTFDVPFMETRWAFHRRACPMSDVTHFDMLPLARRMWSRRESLGGDEGGCSLSTLERSVLGMYRVGDVPGFEIPSRYFQFLRTGEPGLIDGVLDHNRHDLVSLAVIVSHASWLIAEGPDACRDAGEQLALGQIYDRAGLCDRAHAAYERAATGLDADVRRRALAALAVMLRRASRFEESAEAWQQVLDLSTRHAAPSPLDRRAAEALAIHHEHRRKDPMTARRYAEALRQRASGSQQRDTEHRLKRLEKKLSGRFSVLD